MHNTEEKDTPSHLVKYVDLMFFHLWCDRASGGVVRGKNTNVKTLNILERKVLLLRELTSITMKARDRGTGSAERVNETRTKDHHKGG